MTGINKYLGLFQIKLKVAVQYRFAFFMGVFSAAFQIAIQYAIWMQVFRERSIIGGFAQRDMFTYLLVSQAIQMVFAFRNAPERMISQKIRQGDIALELIHPVHFTLARFFENLGDSLSNVILAVFFVLIWGMCSRSFILPARWEMAALFLLSCIFSYLLTFFMSMITGYLTFFTMNFWGIYNAKKVVVDLLSGALIPITFFPEAFQRIFAYMPFQNIVYTPTMIFLEKYSFQKCTEQLLIQFFWVVVMAIGNELVYRSAVRRVSVNGG